MATILGRLVSQGERPSPTKSCDPLITWSGDHATSEKRYIFVSTRPMATKFDREVTSDEMMLSKKSHNLLIT